MGEGGHHFPPLSVSSTRFSLSSSQCSSSVQRSPPTRSRTDRVQHIQGGRSASPHSSLRRVSVLSRSCPLCHFFSSPSLLPPSLGLSFSLSLMQWQVLSVSAQSQRSDACQPRLTAQHTPLTFTACQINRQACSETCSFARTHGKFGLVLLCL